MGKDKRVLNMSLEQFVISNIGRKIDYDGAYGCQCVDLYRLYCQDVLNIPQTPTVTGAMEVYKKSGTLKAIPHSYNQTYFRGDIMVWGSTETNKYGHIAIFLTILDDEHFIVFEQDGFKQDGAKLNVRSKKALLGCLRK